MDSIRQQRESFTIGEAAVFARTFTQADVQMFSQLSGDCNPIHLDEKYSKQTRFGGPIIHGMLVASLISTVLGTILPGPGSVYVSQQLSFRAPARVGERLTARVQVTAWDANRGRVILATEIVNDRNEQLIVGEAKLVLSSFLN